MDSCFTLTGEASILHLHSGSCWILLMLYNPFPKKGCPFDNACCECFFKFLKKEETNRKTYHTLQELQLSVFEYIEGLYNSRRPHGTLGMLTPNQAESLFWQQT